MGKPLFKSIKQIAVDAQALKLAMQRGDNVSNGKSTVRYEDDDSAYINTVLPDVVVTPKYDSYDDYNKTIAARDRRALEQQQREMNNYVRAGMNKAGEVVAGAMMMLPPVAAADPIAAGVGRILKFAIPRLRTAARTSQAIANNVAEWTPEQWTAAQDAAITRGDIAEAQRLRDLHFKVAAPDTKIVTESGMPLKTYHTSHNKFNSFKQSLDNEYDGFGVGNYFSKGIVDRGPIKYETYLNSNNPYIAKYKQNLPTTDGKSVRFDNINNDYLVRNHSGVFGLEGKEITIYDPKNIKSADAVTYDNNGVRVPLGERDNFNMNDIRYALPFVLPSSRLSTEDEVDDTQLNN